jgi:hypothetical protein
MTKSKSEVVSVLVPKVLARSKAEAKRILAQAGYTARFGLVEMPNNYRAAQSVADAKNFRTDKRRRGGLRLIRGEKS